ncbi:hypothetical protein IJ095_02850 [Candidatus Saccharibacteria bacterium]|nr:hypothetical protein [Candidatus Saccharibacteria bacterium]
MEDYNRAKKERELDPFADKAEGYESAEIDKSRSRTDKIFHVEKKQEEAPKKPKIELMEFQKKRLMVAGIVVCVLASLGIFYAVFRERITEILSPSQETALRQEQQKLSDQIAIVKAEAEKIITEAGPYAAIRYFDERISTETDPKLVAQLYAGEASVLYSYAENSGEDWSERILLAAYQAEEASPSDLTAYDLYNYLTLFGRAEEAQTYYELALKRGYITVQANPTGYKMRTEGTEPYWAEDGVTNEEDN